MKAVTFQGVGDVKVEDVADPTIVDPTDVVVRITTSAVCGSDLHQYHGRGADSSRGAPSWATSSWGSSRSSDPR